MRNGRYGRDPRLTTEQDRIRLQGLRVLARMIARAHLASLVAQDGGGNGPVSDSSPSQVAKEGKDAG